MIKSIRYSTVGIPGFFALMIFAISGCSSDSEHIPATPLTPVMPSYMRLSSTAPPDPMPETDPMTEDPQHQMWRAGYWSNDSGTFEWVPGAILPKPSFTAVWAPDHWEQREYGWAFVPGYWQ